MSTNQFATIAYASVTMTEIQERGLPKTSRMTAQRWVILIILVGDGVISVLLKAWQGDPQALAVAVAGVALIAAQALAVVLLGLYEDVQLSRRTLLIAVGVFYFSTVGVFAAVFAYLDGKGGIYRPDGTPLSPVGALYLSVATLTGLGYADRYPESDPAKLLAIIEVLTGLAYAVFIFALLSQRAARVHLFGQIDIGSEHLGRALVLAQVREPRMAQVEVPRPIHDLEPATENGPKPAAAPADPFGNQFFPLTPFICP